MYQPPHHVEDRVEVIESVIKAEHGSGNPGSPRGGRGAVAIAPSRRNARHYRRAGQRIRRAMALAYGTRQIDSPDHSCEIAAPAPLRQEAGSDENQLDHRPTTDCPREIKARPPQAGHRNGQQQFLAMAQTIRLQSPSQ